MNFSVALSSANPVIAESNTWATPIFGVVYLVLVIVALTSLLRTNVLSAPVKALIAVAILGVPFLGAVAWIVYFLIRVRGRAEQHENS